MPSFTVPRLFIYTDQAAIQESEILILGWIRARTSQLNVVIITSALIASVISGLFSWQMIETAPWTSQACFYSALTLALISIFSGSQQSIALHRVGKHNANRMCAYLWDRKDSRALAYVFQIPVMLMGISIWILLIGLFILIWDRAASSNIWGADMKIALTTSIGAFYALLNYALSCIFVWRMNSDLYEKFREETIHPETAQTVSRA